MQQPSHDLLDTVPFWQVQAVHDPDGTGRDFAYTIGLHTRGLPELHLWARPGLGEDPGLDWKFSQRDCCGVLNELAGMLVAGRLGVGDAVVREYDAGLARVTFRVDPPGDREELEAYGVPPGIMVLPVRWSLSREPEGELRPLTAEAESAARSAFTELVCGLDPDRRGPRGWTLPSAPTFEPAQRFGPLTSLVLARAAQLWQADEQTLTELAGAAMAASHGNNLTWPTCVARGLARPAGRRHALEELESAVVELVDHLTQRPAAQARWRRIGAALDTDWWATAPGREREHFLDCLAHALREMTLSCLMVESVADLADEPLLLLAQGPWVSGLRGEPVLSDPRWRAAPEVLDVVRRLLAPLDARTLGVVAGLHVIACRRRVTGVPGYADLCSRLQSWALTAAAACPWSPVLEGLPAWRPLLAPWGPHSRLARLAELEDWATCLASALVHRARLSAEDVETLTRLYAQDVPGLREALDAPL